MEPSKTSKNDAKKVFKELGTCSRTFFHLLNREFDNTKETEERAADPLAGGIMQKGQQCGMLWGAALAVGAESYRRCNDRDQAIGLAIKAAQNLTESFSKRADTVNCRDITNCNLDSFFGMTKFMIKTTLKGMKNSTCFILAEKWAPEAIESAKEGLALQQTELPKKSISCASEVARKMGASDEEMVAVAGFSGGLGLSGNGCGALSAAIWKNSLVWSRTHPGKSAWSNPNAKNTLKEFNEETDSEMLCHKICGQRFETIEDHSAFIKNGGCRRLINVLAAS
ncbi:MAG: C-GCAxxG-C-C family protein [Aureibaculum sp.]|nr:C-GCAxxG-C-C family protein [Aureibaculum sp.]